MPWRLVPTLFAAAHRQRAVTVMVATVGLGLPLGPIVGGFLLDRFWWGSVFLLTVPVVACSLGAGLVLLPRVRPDAPPRLDLPEVLAAVASIVLATYALVEAPARRWTAPLTLECLGLALLAGGFAVLRQRTSSRPLIPRGLLADRLFVGGTTVTAVVTFVLTGVLFLIPMHLQLVLGYDAKGTGLRLSPFMLCLVLAGGLADRVGARFPLVATATAGLLTSSAGSLIFAGIGRGSGYAVVALGLALSGFGMGLTRAPVMDHIIGALPPAAEGIGSAVNNTARQVAGALGVAVLGSLAATRYADGVAGVAAHLPDQAAETVRGSLAGAQAVAAGLPPGLRDRVTATADAAFVGGLRAALMACAVGCLLAALATPRLLAAAGAPDAEPAMAGARFEARS